MTVTKAMKDAFQEGFTNPGAPLTPGEARLLRPRAGPRLLFVETVAEVDPPVIHLGELSHKPYDGDEDIVDAEIVQ